MEAEAIKYIDLQVNGYVGVDFNDPSVTIEQIGEAAFAMQQCGVTTALPTVITASKEDMLACISNLVNAIRNDVTVASVFSGIHIEGPFLSPLPGYIGAHPAEHAQAEDGDLLRELCDACDGLARIVTLAPEVDLTGGMTAYCASQGIRVAAGHTDAGLEDLRRCIDAGLSLFTHLGNGCPRLMDRHDNIIYRALQFRDRISYSLIADGFHVPEILFRLLLDWIPHDRLIVVSDAISAAGLGPGTYRLAHREVTIGPDKAARDPSGEHFVGAACSMRDADEWLANQLGLSDDQRRNLLLINAGNFLNCADADTTPSQ